MSDYLITKMLNKSNVADSFKGYYSDDELLEDLTIVPEENGEFGSYRQCLSFELSGKGYHALNQETLKGKYVQTRAGRKIERESEPEDILVYMKEKYGYDASSK
jgi:hypothetical protein